MAELRQDASYLAVEKGLKGGSLEKKGGNREAGGVDPMPSSSSLLKVPNGSTKQSEDYTKLVRNCCPRTALGGSQVFVKVAELCD